MFLGHLFSVYFISHGQNLIITPKALTAGPGSALWGSTFSFYYNCHREY